MTLIVAGAIGLLLSVIGIIASVVLALPSWRSYWRQVISSQRENRELPGVIIHDHLLAVREDRLRDDIDELYRKVHYRHNVHCRRCGRFARAVDGLPGAADCKWHGITATTPTMVIEIVPTDTHGIDLELPLAELLKLS